MVAAGFSFLVASRPYLGTMDEDRSGSRAQSMGDGVSSARGLVCAILAIFLGRVERKRKRWWGASAFWTSGEHRRIAPSRWLWRADWIGAGYCSAALSKEL